MPDKIDTIKYDSKGEIVRDNHGYPVLIQRYLVRCPNTKCDYKMRSTISDFPCPKCGAKCVVIKKLTEENQGN